MTFFHYTRSIGTFLLFVIFCYFCSVIICVIYAALSFVCFCSFLLHHQQRDQSQGGQLGEVPTAGELLGRTHEELVLLLIQLRRRHAATHRAIEQCCFQIHSIEVLIFCFIFSFNYQFFLVFLFLLF